MDPCKISNTYMFNIQNTYIKHLNNNKIYAKNFNEDIIKKVVVDRFLKFKSLNYLKKTYKLGFYKIKFLCSEHFRLKLPKYIQDMNGLIHRRYNLLSNIDKISKENKIMLYDIISVGGSTIGKDNIIANLELMPYMINNRYKERFLKIQTKSKKMKKIKYEFSTIQWK
jgi:hypothetical protein